LFVWACWFVVGPHVKLSPDELYALFVSTGGHEGMKLRRRYYLLFVAREDDGQLRKIPVPLKYAYGFVAAALVGAFTIVGLAGSYTRMLLKTESYNQVRADRETLRQNYQKMQQIAQNRSVQVASWPTPSTCSIFCAAKRFQVRFRARWKAE
jgi:hypothetical protein